MTSYGGVSPCSSSATLGLISSSTKRRTASRMARCSSLHWYTTHLLKALRLLRSPPSDRLARHRRRPQKGDAHLAVDEGHRWPHHASKGAVVADESGDRQTAPVDESHHLPRQERRGGVHSEPVVAAARDLPAERMVGRGARRDVEAQHETLSQGREEAYPPRRNGERGMDERCGRETRRLGQD